MAGVLVDCKNVLRYYA